MGKEITRRDALILTGNAIAGAKFFAGPACDAATSSGAGTPIPAISDYERDSGGRIGVYANNIRTRATLHWRADDRFVMCSTFKASLAACVLARVDRGQDDLEKPVHFGAADLQDFYAPVAKENLARGFLSVKEMCRAAVEQSDNACANLLLSRIGGPPAMTAFWRAIGDPITRLDDYEPLLNRTPLGGVQNTTTPAAMANTLRRLALGNILLEGSRKTLTDWLINCQTGGNRLRAGLPAKWVIGDKTGNNGKDAAGDIVVAWPRPDISIVICVYTRGGSPSSEHLDTAFAAIGRFVGAHFSADT
jgi:beta-lactamase class A